MKMVASLTSIPIELRNHIVTFLRLVDVLSISQTCKSLRVASEYRARIAHMETNVHPEALPKQDGIYFDFIAKALFSHIICEVCERSYHTHLHPIDESLTICNKCLEKNETYAVFHSSDVEKFYIPDYETVNLKQSHPYFFSKDIMDLSEIYHKNRNGPENVITAKHFKERIEIAYVQISIYIEMSMRRFLEEEIQSAVVMETLDEIYRTRFWFRGFPRPYGNIFQGELQLYPKPTDFLKSVVGLAEEILKMKKDRYEFPFCLLQKIQEKGYKHQITVWHLSILNPYYDHTYISDSGKLIKPKVDYEAIANIFIANSTVKEE